MRIVAGTHKSKAIKAPAGDATRPTSDRVRESLFASLERLNMFSDATVLDVFAGSGALGLEALSRGALHVTFVDRAASAMKAIEANIAAFGVSDDTQLLGMPVAKACKQLGAEAAGRFDLVFADPPYPMSEEEVTECLTALVPLLKDSSSLIVLERSVHSPEPVLPMPLTVFKDKSWGQTRVWMLELVGAGEESGAGENSGAEA